MKLVLGATLLITILPSVGLSQSADDTLRSQLRASYEAWRSAVVRRDAGAWERATAEHRRAEVRNRLVSEKRPFPAAVFQLPAPPPRIDNLLLLDAPRSGPTAKAAFFGKIDFGVGGEPADNLLVLSFVNSGGRWLYDKADFINLAALPDVRAELAKGDIRYLWETPDARPSGSIPPTPALVPPARIIAKVYAFCPGREMRVQVNRISRHRFANAKEAEVVLGGAYEGDNQVQFALKKLDGATGKEALALRVYLLSTVPGVKPIKAFEYLVPEGGMPEASGTKTFRVDARTLWELNGRK